MSDSVRKIDSEYTVEDIFNLPDGQRAELIDGIWFDMATPTVTHQRIVASLSAEMHSFIKGNRLDFEVYVARLALFLKDDGKNYLEPDITVICDKKKLDEKGCHGAPDIVVEVLSPSTKDRDLGIKLFLYRQYGVREYWVINPDANVSTIYHFSLQEDTAEIIDQLPFDSEITSRVLEGFTVKISELL